MEFSFRRVVLAIYNGKKIGLMKMTPGATNLIPSGCLATFRGIFFQSAFAWGDQM
jgi:hypothetical protein